MNLADKRDLLKNKELELKKLKEKSSDLTEKIKSVEVDDDAFAQMQADAKAVSDSAKALSDEINGLVKDIENEEKALNDLSEKMKKENEQKLKGGNKMDYLKSKGAIADFAEMLAKTGGRDALKKSWNEHLETKGISNPDYFLPEAVVTAITDAFDKAGGIFATFKYTGLTMLKVGFNTNTDDATSRAKGHKRGTQKQEQIITLDDKEIRAQYIYKYITIDKQTLRETKDTGAVINYVLSELPNRIVAEIERAAMIGDGRATNANDKIKSYESVARATSDGYVTVQTETADLLSDLVLMDATVEASGARYLVISRQTLANIKLSANNGGLVFPIGSDIASALGFAQIFTPDFMNADGAPKAIEYVGDAYKTVGDNTMDSYDNFELQQNVNEYLMEIYSGGGLDTPKAGAVLLPASGE